MAASRRRPAPWILQVGPECRHLHGHLDGRWRASARYRWPRAKRLSATSLTARRRTIRSRRRGDDHHRRNHPGAGDGFYVQFTGFTAGNGSHETIDRPAPANGVQWPATCSPKEPARLHQSWVVGLERLEWRRRRHVNGPDAMNFSLLSSDPKGDLTPRRHLPTASAQDMFLTFDGSTRRRLHRRAQAVGGYRDSGHSAGDSFTTKAIVVEAGDMYLFDGWRRLDEGDTVAALGRHSLRSVVADIVAFGRLQQQRRSRDHRVQRLQRGRRKLSIVGAQIINTTAGVSRHGDQSRSRRWPARRQRRTTAR